MAINLLAGLLMVNWLPTLYSSIRIMCWLRLNKQNCCFWTLVCLYPRSSNCKNKSKTWHTTTDILANILPFLFSMIYIFLYDLRILSQIALRIYNWKVNQNGWPLFSKQGNHSIWKYVAGFQLAAQDASRNKRCQWPIEWGAIRQNRGLQRHINPTMLGDWWKAWGTVTENGWVTTIIFSSIILFSVSSSDILDFEPLELGCTVFTLHEKRTVHAHKVYVYTVKNLTTLHGNILLNSSF